jgi:hypothetical protein
VDINDFFGPREELVYNSIDNTRIVSTYVWLFLRILLIKGCQPPKIVLLFIFTYNPAGKKRFCQLVVQKLKPSRGKLPYICNTHSYNIICVTKAHKSAKSDMSTESCRAEKESALCTASQNGEVLHVQRLLDEKTNPNCSDSVSNIE